MGGGLSTVRGQPPAPAPNKKRAARQPSLTHPTWGDRERYRYAMKAGGAEGSYVYEAMEASVVGGLSIRLYRGVFARATPNPPAGRVLPARG